jgi:hypothetical protein
MDSPSRPRKRGSEDQLDNQIENSEPDNIKRSKTSLECILEPISAGDPKFTGNLPVSGDDRAPYVYDYNADLREQQNRKRLMMTGQPRREEGQLPGTVARESVRRRDSQTPVNGNTGQGPITNDHNMFAVPKSTRQEDQGIALAGQPNRPVVRKNHNNRVGRDGNHGLQDYQMQLTLVEQQNQKRLSMEKKAREEQDTAALRMITSLPDQLNIAHTAVKEMLENLSAYFQNIEDLKRSIPRDIKTLQGYEEKHDKKEAEIKAIENRFDELLEMTPEAQQGELRQVKDKAMLTMQQDLEKLRLNRDNTAETVEGKNERIAGLEGALVKSKELLPELIKDLIKLTPKLRDVRLSNSSASIKTTGEYYGED